MDQPNDNLLSYFIQLRIPMALPVEKDFGVLLIEFSMCVGESELKNGHRNGRKLMRPVDFCDIFIATSGTFHSECP